MFINQVTNGENGGVGMAKIVRLQEKTIENKKTDGGRREC